MAEEAVDPRLAPFAARLGDPARYFVDAEWRMHPLVIEHATGAPRYAIVGAELVPFDRYRRPAPPPRPEKARPEKALGLQAEPGTFAGSVAVANPSPNPVETLRG